MGKVFGGLVLILIIIGALFYFGILKFGFGGDGTGTSKNTETVSKEAEKEVQEEITVTIVVKQDKYFVDEKEVTLTEIKSKVTEEGKKIKVVLENNYAGAQVWDEIKKNLAEWNIVPVEQ